MAPDTHTHAMPRRRRPQSHWPGTEHETHAQNEGSPRPMGVAERREMKVQLDKQTADLASYMARKMRYKSTEKFLADFLSEYSKEWYIERQGDRGN